MKKLAVKFALTLSLCLVAAMLPNTIQAAVTVSDDILLVSPATPGPQSPTTVTITDPLSIGVGGTARWFVDGVERTDDQNAKSISLTTKGAGEVTNVELRLSDGQVFSASIEPVRVDLVVSANSHVPSFYLGRSLPSRGSTINVRALVFGDDSGPYAYNWSVNGRPVTSAVGGGNDLITFSPGLDYEMFVSVDVYSQQGELVARSDVRIPLADQEVYFYEQNPLHGLLRNIIPSPYLFLKDEITLHAEPFFFAGSTSDLEIKWRIDRQTTGPDQNPLELTLAKTTDTGHARIDIDIINKTNLVEKGGNTLQLSF